MKEYRKIRIDEDYSTIAYSSASIKFKQLLPS